MVVRFLTLAAAAFILVFLGLMAWWAWDSLGGHEPQLDANGGGGNVTIVLTPEINVNVNIDGNSLEGNGVVGPPAPTATTVPQQDPTVSTNGNGSGETTSGNTGGNAINVGITGGTGTGNGCGSDSNVQCVSTEVIPGTNIPAYAQTGTNGSNEWYLTVPQGYGMVLGGLQVTGSINSVNQPGNDIPEAQQGILVAIPSGNHVAVNVKNGFYVLVPEINLGGKDGELCSRYREALGQGWSTGLVYTPPSWGEDPCDLKS